MKEIVIALIKRFGSQVNAAEALGVSDRAFRNYVRFPEKIPFSRQSHMRAILRSEDALASPPPSEARP